MTFEVLAQMEVVINVLITGKKSMASHSIRNFIPAPVLGCYLLEIVHSTDVYYVSGSGVCRGHLVGNQIVSLSSRN